MSGRSSSRSIARTLGVTEGAVRYHLRRQAVGAVDGRSEKPRRSARWHEAITTWLASRSGDAISLTYEPGRSVAAVATDLGIDRSLLQRWRVQMRPDDVAEAAARTGKPRTTSDEIQHLRRELARVTEEREILKKALAFFAKHRS